MNTLVSRGVRNSEVLLYNFLTAGLQNILLLQSVLEGWSSPTFMFFVVVFKICSKDS